MCIRDRGTNLLGVKAVIAQSFERIHRSNLLGMGVLPLQFKEDASVRSLGIDGSETFALLIRRANGETVELPLTLRIDTPIEVDYYLHGGILPYVLRQLLGQE